MENQAAGGGGGGGDGVVPVSVCALFMGHIGYISLKTKNIIFFLYHQGLFVLFFAKTRNYKKKRKRSVSAVHFEADMSVLCISASCRLLTPSGPVLWARTRGSCIQEVSVGPPTRRSRQPNIH